MCHSFHPPNCSYSEVGDLENQINSKKMQKLTGLDILMNRWFRYFTLNTRKTRARQMPANASVHINSSNRALTYSRRRSRSVESGGGVQPRNITYKPFYAMFVLIGLRLFLRNWNSPSALSMKPMDE